MNEPCAETPERDGRSQDAEQHRTDCVVVDTNELRSSLLLNSAMGAALLFAIQQRNGKLGWPEVIELEIHKQAMRAALEAIDAVSTSLRKLETLIGWRPDPTLPSKGSLDTAIRGRIDALAPLLVRVPFTIEHARSALQRVNDETPPNTAKNQQFKDSAVWEAILELAVAHRVHFVTRDTGFYGGRDLKNGLAKELSAECERSGLEVFIYPELAVCVEALRTAAPPFDYTAVAEAVNASLRNQLRTEVSKRDFALGEIAEPNLSAFITESMGILAIKYDFIYSGNDTSSQVPPRTHVSIRASGNARFDMGSAVASDVQLGQVEMNYVDAEGEHKQANVYIGVADIMLGERLVKYHLEHPIDP